MNTAESKLLKAAHQCFLAKGIQKTTMHDIAVEAGLTRRTIYHHFKNKDDILLAVIMQGHHEYIANLEDSHSYTGNFRECMVEIFMFSVKMIKSAEMAKYFYDQEVQAKVNSFHLTLPFFAENTARALARIYKIKLKQGEANEGEDLLFLAELHNRLIVSLASSPSPFYKTDAELESFARQVFLAC